MEITDGFREIIASHIRNNGNATTQPQHHAVSPFMQHAIQLRNRLSSIEDFVSRNSQSYLLVKPLLWSEIPFITDAERGIIDDNLERQLHEASRWLEQLKEEVKKSYRQTTTTSHTNGAAGIREHNQNIVVALLARLSGISKKVGRLQTAHYEAVLTSQSPFASWIALKNDKVSPKSSSIYPLILPELPNRLLSSSPTSSYSNHLDVVDTNSMTTVPLLIHAICSTMSESEAIDKSGKIRSKGANSIEQYAYAVLLTAAHEQLRFLDKKHQSSSSSDKNKSNGVPYDFFGTAVESFVLISNSGNASHYSQEWERVMSAACHCWHWKELYDRLQAQDLDVQDRSFLRAMCTSATFEAFKLEEPPDEFQAYLAKLGRTAYHNSDEDKDDKDDENEDDRKDDCVKSDAHGGEEGLSATSASTDTVGKSVRESSYSLTKDIIMSRLAQKKTDPFVSNLTQSQQQAYNQDSNNGEKVVRPSATQLRYQQQQQQQQLVMEAEHESLGMELAGELDAVLKTEMKMREVSEIMALFSEKVAEQAEDVAAIFEITEEVEADVDAGHEQLIDASKRRRVARHIYVTITLVLSFILLFMDFVFD